MIYYREHNITKQLFRRLSGGLGEEYNFKTHKWEEGTTAAIDAFFEGTDTYQITEQLAKTIIENSGGQF